MGPLISLALLCLPSCAPGFFPLVTRLCSRVLCLGYPVMLRDPLLWLPGYAPESFALVTRLCFGILSLVTWFCSGIPCFGYPVMLRSSCFGYPILLRDPLHWLPSYAPRFFFLWKRYTPHMPPTPPRWHNTDQFCSFHRATGYSTDDCVTLQDTI